MNNEGTSVRYVTRGPEPAGLFARAVSEGGGERLLLPCDGNQPPAEGSYLCCVAVHDYWRMSAISARTQGVWHYAEGLESRVLADIRTRRCALVFDLCNEGVAYDAAIFDELLQWMDANRIPPGQVVWLDQNRNIREHCEAMAGERRNWVRFEHYDLFIKAMALMFAPASAPHAIAAPAALLVSRMFDLANKDRMLLCLNATPRLSRILTLGALLHHDLLACSLVSFPGIDYAKESISAESVHSFIDQNPVLSYLKPGIEATLELRDLRVDDFAEKGNALFAKVDARAYERTFFSLVTETDFTDGSVRRVTEKTVKSFCFGHPTLVVGNPHSTAMMKSLGFEDWGEVIDQSYDAEVNPTMRLLLVIQEVLRQVEAIRTDPARWIRRTRDLGSANIQHAFSGKFLAQYRTTYDYPLVARLAAIAGAT